jgi:hypothetical protein
VASTAQTLDPPSQEPAQAEHPREENAPKASLWRRLTARRDPIALWLGALAVVIAAAFVIIDLAYNEGNFIAPLDDTYIHLQYASQLGQGNFFRYNPGDPISTGASSVLYALVLGAAYVIGFQGTLLLPFAVIFGILCYALTVMGTYVLGRRLMSKQAGIWAGVLVAVNGPLVWGATSGMEVGLVALLFVATLLAFVKEAPGHRFVTTPITAVLLALVRPEGLIFAGVICCAMGWTLLTALRQRILTRGTALARALWILLPIAAGAGQLLFYKLATGVMSANGIQSKSVLNDRPILFVEDAIDRTVTTLRGYIDIFNGMSTREYAFPGALLLFLIGFVYLVVKRSPWRPLVIAMMVGFVTVFVSTATLNSALSFHLRYVQPLTPVFVLFVVAGVYGLAQAVTHPRARRVGPHTVLAIVLIFSLVTLPSWGLRFGRESAQIRDMVVTTGAWVKGNLPKEARIGVLDVGAIAYFGEREVVDIIGLATNNMAKAYNNGTGSVYEALRHMPADQRPDYYAIYQGVGGRFITEMNEVGLLANPPLLSLGAQTPNHIFDGRITPYDRMEVYRADWSAAGSGDEIRTSGTVRDYLNVADLDSEAKHGYVPQMAHVSVQPTTFVRRVGPILDSSRKIVGGEQFTAGNLTPGKPVTITSRAEITGEAEARVMVNGKEAGMWQRKSSGTDWNQDTFTIPGDLVDGSSVTVELAPARQGLGPYPQYISYGYWFSQ